MTIEWGTLRPNTSARMIARYAVSDAEIPLQKILEGTGIEPADLRAVDGAIPFRAELAMIRNLLSLTGGGPTVGLLVGDKWDLGSLGIWGLSLATAPTVRAFIELGTDYMGPHTYGRWIPRPLRNGGLELACDHDGMPSDVRRFMVERDIAMAEQVRKLIGVDALYAERLEIPFPLCPPYQSWRSAVVPRVLGGLLFGCPEIKWTYRAEVLERPVGQADSDLTVFYQQQCAALLAERKGRREVSTKVREELVRQGITATHRSVADAETFKVTERTLRRRLESEGTTFRELYRETFGMMAEEMLRQGMTPKQVQTRMGYPKPADFTAAFKSWKHMTPSDFARSERIHETHYR